MPGDIPPRHPKQAPATATCPTCGVRCRVVGKTTQHYQPVVDGAEAEETLGAATDALIQTIENGSHPASDARLVLSELRRWATRRGFYS